MLGTNVITQQMFPVWHVTNVKHYLGIWWHRMWWHPNGEALLKASKHTSRKSRDSVDIIATVDGIQYSHTGKVYAATFSLTTAIRLCAELLRASR